MIVLGNTSKEDTTGTEKQGDRIIVDVDKKRKIKAKKLKEDAEKKRKK